MKRLGIAGEHKAKNEFEKQDYRAGLLPSCGTLGAPRLADPQILLIIANTRLRSPTCDETRGSRVGWQKKSLWPENGGFLMRRNSTGWHLCGCWCLGGGRNHSGNGPTIEGQSLKVTEMDHVAVARELVTDLAEKHLSRWSSTLTTTWRNAASRHAAGHMGQDDF